MAARKLNLDQLQAAAKWRHSGQPVPVKKPRKKKIYLKAAQKPVVKIDPVPAQVVAQVEKQPEIKEKPGKQVDWDQLNRFFRQNMTQKLF